MQAIVQAAALFFITAIAEIVGCYLPYLWLKKDGPTWYLLVAAFSLMAFVWLLTLHPFAAGRVYAAYGGAYVFTAMLWLYFVEKAELTQWDIVGAVVSIAGMAIIVAGASTNVQS